MNSITISFTQEELNNLATLLDAGLKANGLAVVKQAAAIITKLENAVATANTSNQKPDE